MALNLVRNSKVFFTTNVDSTSGVIQNSGFTPSNTYEIQVLDGLSFSQTTSNETVSVSESGSTPVRGTRSFNTQLAAADFSFSGYLRPDFMSTTTICEESVLWNAFAGDQSQFGTGVAIGSITGATYTGSSGQVAINGTTLTNLASFKPNMICYLPAPFTAATIGSVLSANQLAGFAGLVRVVSITGTTQIIFEYLLKPNATSATGITAATSLTVLPSNSIVPTGVSATSYTAATNLFTITGATNYASFVVGTHYIFKNLAGTNGATFNDVPAKCTKSDATSVTFVFATSALDSTDRATGVITTTDFFVLKTSWVPTTGASTNSYMSLMNSNKNQLLKCGFLIVVDQVTYALDNAVLTQVSIDFGIDAIATAAWTGQATALRQYSTNLTTNSVTSSVGAFQGTLTVNPRAVLHRMMLLQLLTRNFILQKIPLLSS